ncbi:PAS domain S-box protein [Magnetospirillum sp. UT-4]|uniref:PAS domain S-box protein n=1 Tax=Magnetospirillum sp. UT-4 TaxID=2681467 RepID=UPI0015735328|nr:PAS domain S-box protein [Magnetospirillum sp. UT-4]
MRPIGDAAVGWGRFLPALAVFALFFALLSVGLSLERQRQVEELRGNVTREAALMFSRLEGELKSNLYLANGLIAYVSANPEGTAGVEVALASVFSHGRHLRNVGLAPGNRLTWIHPRTGNESAIGLYYPDLPRQWPAVKRAMDERATVLAGPVDLVQGGRGLISRTPVYLGDTYWGMLSLVLDPDRLFAEIGMAPTVGGIRFALRGRDGLGERGAVFFGSPELFEAKAVLLTLSVPGGTWQMAALPEAGWQGDPVRLAWLQAVALFAALLMAALTHALVIARLRAEAGRRRLQAVVRELSDREASLREFSEAATDWYWETDPDHRFVWFSPSFEHVVGIPSAPLLGRRRWDVASDQNEIDAAQWRAHIDDLGAHRRFRDFRYWIRAGADRNRWISVSGMPRFGEDGIFLGYRGSGTDITDQAEMNVRLRLLSQVVEQSPVSVVVTTPDGTIEYVNQRFTEVTGFAKDEVIGQNPRIIASGETPVEVYQDLWDTVNTGRPWRGELKNRKRDGEFYWETAYIAPIVDEFGHVVHLVGIKEDITFRKKAADELVEANSRLARQAEELARSNAELEQFSYVASHDLRQPLRMVSSYVSLLERRIEALLDEEGRQFIHFARDGAQRMDRLITDLLAYSRIGRSDAAPEPVPLGEVAEEALHDLQAAVADSQGEVTVPEGLPVVSGVRSELARLFLNLIGNALKYRAPGTSPVVAVSWRDAGPAWEIAIRDNGIGIAPDQRERAFGIFQRLHGHERYEGTGIGLAVCRKIVENHGGRIWLEGNDGPGCTVRFCLPKRR